MTPLAQAQRDLHVGSFWIRFTNPAENVFTFGHIWTPERIFAMKQPGPDDSWEPLLDTIEDCEQRLLDGYAFGESYTRFTDEPTIESVPLAEVWPIEFRLYVAAGSVHWDVSRLNDDFKMLVRIAHRQMRAHQITNGVW